MYEKETEGAMKPKVTLQTVNHQLITNKFNKLFWNHGLEIQNS